MRESLIHRLKSTSFSQYIPFLIFFICVAAILIPYGDHGGVPGDAGDGRFNRYVLEHFYLALTGKISSFLNAPFYYPWVKTISFSDTYWGNGLFYVLFRVCHFPPEKSYLLWFYVGFILNYWAAYCVSRSLGLREFGASMSAFIFTFSLPVIWQDHHPQLLYRFYVPLAFLTLHTYLRKRDPRLLATTALLLALQFLTSLYNGVFLTYLLAAYFIVWRFFSAGRSIEYFKEKSCYRSYWITAIMIFIVAAALFLLFAIPYLEVQHLYGFHRTWGEIENILPRVQSYFMAEESSLWFPGDSRAFANVPAGNEQQLFIGIGALIILLYAIFSKKFLRYHPLSQQLLLTVAILIVVTLSIGGFSFYQPLTWLPGIGSVRAVARIMLVLVFPLGLVIGEALDTLATYEFKWVRTYPLLFVLCLLIIEDSIIAKKRFSYSKDWYARIQALADQIKTPVTKDSILVVAESDLAWPEDLDAMIYSQMKGIKTINGYSGNTPPGFQHLKTCADVDQTIKAAENFYQKKLHQPFKVDRTKIIYVGFHENCQRETVANHA